jgi:hypothetical protein
MPPRHLLEDIGGVKPEDSKMECEMPPESCVMVIVSCIYFLSNGIVNIDNVAHENIFPAG